MTIETKFNPGDSVWVMKDNKPYQFKVSKMEIVIFQDSTIREMYIDYIRGVTSLDSSKHITYMADECFATKRDLLNSYLEEGE